MLFRWSTAAKKYLNRLSKLFELVFFFFLSVLMEQTVELVDEVTFLGTDSSDCS